MLLTEDEAKERWCPFARTADAYASISREHKGQMRQGCRCLGSDCMAWYFDTDGNASRAQVWVAGDQKKPPADLGYCGLAGKP